MNIVLFFTYKISLKVWHEKGLIDRELEIYKELSKKGHNVTFLTYGRNDNQYADKTGDIDVVHKTCNIPNFLYSILLPILKWHQIKDADVLKTNQMNGGWSAIIAKYLHGIPVVLRCGFEWHYFAKRRFSLAKTVIIWTIELFSYQLADIIVISSKSAKKYIVEKFGCQKDKVKVINNYINTEKFKPNKKTKKCSHIRGLFVGRLEPQKNLDMLLKSVCGMENIKITIVGEGSMKEELKSMPETEETSVEFIGRIPNDDVPNIMNKSDFFVLPSKYEGNPKSLLEAMSCGLPVIGTKVEGIKDVITNGYNGVLCEDTCDSLKRSIVSLTSDAGKMAEIGKNARKFILDNFSLENYVRSEMEAYDQALNTYD
jgi:glycosyltransferase involved in cell wall biosynthesis